MQNHCYKNSEPLKKWLKVITHHASMSYKRYEDAIKDSSIPVEVSTDWLNISRHNYGLKALLHHLISYGCIVDKENCLACKSDTGSHLHNINLAYNKWGKWIAFKAS